MNAVMAIEENPPEGCEALTWVFITTLDINTFEKAASVISYYLARWEIEVLFKILKSGCDIEGKCLTDKESLSSLISVCLIIAWRILYVMKMGREFPKISCEVLFSANEWKPVYKVINKGKKLSEDPPPLGEFIRMIGQLGGYPNRKNDPPPGPKVIWSGLSRMYDLCNAWYAFQG
jgi:hypothetical protein